MGCKKFASGVDTVWIAEKLMDRDFLEDRHADDLEHCLEGKSDVETLLYDGHEDVGSDSDPDLRLHGILRCPVEGLDAQILLDPLEEQLDRPARLVKLGDGERRQGEIVGQKDEPLVRLFVEETDPADRYRIQAGAFWSPEDDRLIGTQACSPVHGPGVSPV